MARPTPFGQRFVGWTPYKPPGYPIRDPHHNPYLPLNPQYGSTLSARDVWMEDRTISEVDLRAKIKALTPGKR